MVNKITVQKEALSNLEKSVDVCDGYDFGRQNYILGFWVEGMTSEVSKRRGELLDRFADECVCRKKRE
jgi:hypothetical protein